MTKHRSENRQSLTQHGWHGGDRLSTLKTITSTSQIRYTIFLFRFFILTLFRNISMDEIIFLLNSYLRFDNPCFRLLLQLRYCCCNVFENITYFLSFYVSMLLNTFIASIGIKAKRELAFVGCVSQPRLYVSIRKLYV